MHGWGDDVIPVENSIKYGRLAKCGVYLIDGDHRLNNALNELRLLFYKFLQKTKHI